MKSDKQSWSFSLHPYVNRSLQFRERTDLAINMEDVIESHFIELTTKPSNTLIGIIYRPPNNKLDLFKEYLCELLQKLALQKKKCYLMGDFNLDLLLKNGRKSTHKGFHKPNVFIYVLPTDFKTNKNYKL